MTILVRAVMVRRPSAVGSAGGVGSGKTRMLKVRAPVVVVPDLVMSVEREVPAWSLFTTNRMKTTYAILIVFVAEIAFAQSSARFTITRSVIASGGTTFSTSSRFQLGSTIAQPLAAVPSSTRFSIQGGFWIWPAPIIFAPTKVGNNFIFSFQTEPGKTYKVNYADSLTAPSWQTLSSLSGDGSVTTVTNSAPGAAQRFYRLIEQ